MWFFRKFQISKCSENQCTSANHDHQENKYSRRSLSRILDVSNFFVGPLNFSINSRLKYVRYLELSLSNQLFGPLNFSLVISNLCSNLCKIFERKTFHFKSSGCRMLRTRFILVLSFSNFHNYPGWQLSGWQLSWVAIIRVAIVQVAIVLKPCRTFPSVPWEFEITSVDCTKKLITVNPLINAPPPLQIEWFTVCSLCNT